MQPSRLEYVKDGIRLDNLCLFWLLHSTPLPPHSCPSTPLPPHSCLSTPLSSYSSLPFCRFTSCLSSFQRSLSSYPSLWFPSSSFLSLPSYFRKSSWGVGVLWFCHFWAVSSYMYIYWITGRPQWKLSHIISKQHYEKLSLAGTRKVNHSGFYWSKRWWGGSGISWTICKSFAPHSRQITTPLPHHSVLMPFLPPNQRHQSNEESLLLVSALKISFFFLTQNM